MSDNDTTPEIISIKVPTITFVVGDRKRAVLTALRAKDLRPLYGPETAARHRPLVGVVCADQVERLQAMLDYADTHMPLDAVGDADG